MRNRILVTGSEGLVGSALVRALLARGEEVVSFDRRSGSPRRDVRDPGAVARAVAGCRGIVHLAAVSRVLFGERDPELCWSTNVHGTEHVVRSALETRCRPWVLFASSREVYGQIDEFPATEAAPLRPVNVYGRSKVAGERLIHGAQAAGLPAAIVRLSNVYGSADDHPDRVVPAFVIAALHGRTLRVDGSRNTFGFTHISDVTRGLITLIDLLDRGSPPPPLHLVSGKPTALGKLAELAVSVAGSRSEIIEGPQRNFDVSHFYGDPSRAEVLLGWRARVPLRSGIERLAEDHRNQSRRPEVRAP